MIHCCCCGRFCKAGADYSIPYGGYLDSEPPPEEFYCDSCTKRQEEYWIKMGYLPLTSWIKSEWEQRVLSRLGYNYN